MSPRTCCHDARYAVLGTDGVLKMMAAIGAVGENLTRIVRQRLRTGLAIVDIGCGHGDFFHERAIVSIGSQPGPQSQQRAIIDDVALIILAGDRGLHAIIKDLDRHAPNCGEGLDMTPKQVSANPGAAHSGQTGSASDRARG